MSATIRPCRAAERRGAFTLVELLITVTIITILAAMTLFSLHSMTEFGKESNTRATITQIDRLLMLRWESYRTRPMPIRIAPKTSQKAAAFRRLNALRELMRLEMPDRVTDVSTNPSIIPRSSLQLSYRRRVALTKQTWTPKYQGAECLYMIVASIQEGDRNGLDFFNPNDSGDKDGDGMREFLDGWGNPIEFVRWAPGFPSLIQIRNATNSPDPFDPLKADTRWVSGPPANALFAMHPLIVSGGPDKAHGLYGLVDPTSVPGTNNDPYNSAATPNQQLGFRLNGDAPDNIHNHSPEGN